ncbi:hypothetical protein ACWENR_06590 [Micromonospora sp. NPDC004336]
MTLRRLRLGIGTVGIALPIVLTIGNGLLTGDFAPLDSISASYHTDMRDVFVGGMCAIGVFLICYRYRRLDDVLSSIAGTLAIAVAVFPAATGVPRAALTPTDVTIGRLHQVAAAALFVLLAVFCVFLFPQAGPGVRPTRRTRARNGVYRACGGIIVAAIVLAVASNALPDSVRDTLKPLFWCEAVAVAVFAFAVAWLVKGEALFSDSYDPGDRAPVPDHEPAGGATSATGGA